MSKKQQDLLKAKQKKQKMIVAVGGVLLLALLAFQVPRMMKQMNSLNGSAASTATTTSTTTTPTPTPTGSAPPTDGSLTPPTLEGSGSATTTPDSIPGLADSDPAPTAQDGQLVSFSRFLAKDPFNQQIEQNGGSSDDGASLPTKPVDGTTPGSGDGTTPGDGTGTPTPPSAGSGSSGDGTGTGTGTGSGDGTSSGSGDGTSTGGTSTTPTTPTPPPANPTKATISINGESAEIQVGGTFPAAQPFFKLVSLKAGEARIGIADGTLAGGDQTVALVKGKKLTLQNTADGTRYELVLVSTA